MLGKGKGLYPLIILTCRDSIRCADSLIGGPTPKHYSNDDHA